MSSRKISSSLLLKNSSELFDNLDSDASVPKVYFPSQFFLLTQKMEDKKGKHKKECRLSSSFNLNFLWLDVH